ncbi:hypothetical protein R5P67_02505 [Oenococcus oeni]
MKVFDKRYKKIFNVILALMAALLFITLAPLKNNVSAEDINSPSSLNFTNNPVVATLLDASDSSTNNSQIISESKTAVNLLCADDLYTKDPGGYGNEWPIFVLARTGYPVSVGYYDQWFENLGTDLTKMKNGTYTSSSGLTETLDNLKATDYERMLLAISAIGYDPNDITAVNIIKTIEDTAMTDSNSMSKADGLLSLDSDKYDISGGSTVREELISSLTSTLNAYTSNSIIDYISVNLQPLAPYYTPDATDTSEYTSYYNSTYNVTYNAYAVKVAVEHALSLISETQNSEGSWSAWGESTDTDGGSEAAIAVSAMGKNVLTDSDYIKDGNTMITSLLDNFDFSNDTITGSIDEMGEFEIPEALDAMIRTLDGQNNLYNTTDSKTTINTTGTTGNANSSGTVSSSSSGSTSSSTPSSAKSTTASAYTAKTEKDNNAVTSSNSSGTDSDPVSNGTTFGITGSETSVDIPDPIESTVNAKDPKKKNTTNKKYAFKIKKNNGFASATKIPKTNLSKRSRSWSYSLIGISTLVLASGIFSILKW